MNKEIGFMKNDYFFHGGNMWRVNASGKTHTRLQLIDLHPNGDQEGELREGLKMRAKTELLMRAQESKDLVRVPDEYVKMVLRVLRSVQIVREMECTETNISPEYHRQDLRTVWAMMGTFPQPFTSDDCGYIAIQIRKQTSRGTFATVSCLCPKWMSHLQFYAYMSARNTRGAIEILAKLKDGSLYLDRNRGIVQWIPETTHGE